MRAKQHVNGIFNYFFSSNHYVFNLFLHNGRHSALFYRGALSSNTLLLGNFYWEMCFLRPKSLYKHEV